MLGRRLPVPELAHVVVVGAAVDAVDSLPSEEDVAGGLHQPLTLDHPLAVVGVAALVEERLEHRCLGLLHLQEERVGVVPADQQATHDRIPTLPTPTTFRARWTNR